MTGMVYAVLENITIDAEGSSTTHEHSYNYTITVSPTCTTEGKKVGICSCGETTTQAIAKLGHEWGEYKYYTSETCKRTCIRGCTEITSHKSTPQNDEDDDTHKLVCELCNATLGRERHTWGGVDIHTCVNCGYVLEGVYHFYKIGDTAEKDYECQYEGKGNSCSHTISASTSISAGLPAMWYCCSDAIEKMKPVPEFPKGVHTFKYSGKLYIDQTGTPCTTLKAPDSWFKLLGWGQKSVYTHAMPNIDRIYENAQDENGDYTISRAEATSSVLNSSYVRLMQIGPAGYWATEEMVSSMDIARGRNGRVHARI